MSYQTAYFLKDLLLLLKSPDFANAKVYISMLGISDKAEALKVLKKATGFIKSRVAKIHNFRKTPNFSFIFDESVEYGTRINRLINKISEELKENEEKENYED